MAWSQFYAEIKGRSTTAAARCGTKESGMRAFVASKTGAFNISLCHWDGKDVFEVSIIPWGNSKFDEIPLLRGHFVAGEGSPVLRLDDRAVDLHVEDRARQIMLKE